MFEGGRGGIEEVVVVTGYGEGTEEVGLKKICSVIGVRTIIQHLNRPRIFGTQDPREQSEDVHNIQTEW